MERREFEALLRDNWAAVRHAARRFAAGSDLEDICQDVAVVAWRRRESLRDAAAFGAWVRAIALNVGRAYTRRRQGRMGPMQEGDCVAPDPAQGIADADALERALATLTERERKMMNAYANGWAMAEIARFSQEPLGTTKSRLSRSRAKLRQELRRHGWTRFGPGYHKEENDD